MTDIQNLLATPTDLVVPTLSILVSIPVYGPGTPPPLIGTATGTIIIPANIVNVNTGDLATILSNINQLKTKIDFLLE